MFLDADTMLSNAQAVTAAAISSNVIDLGPLYSGNLTRDLGVSELYLCVNIDTTMTDSGSDSTLIVTLESDSAVGLDSSATVHDSFTIPAVSVAGTKYARRLPLGDYERYLGVRYTPGSGGNLSAGAFSAFITKNPDMWKSYASAVSTGI